VKPGLIPSRPPHGRLKKKMPWKSLVTDDQIVAKGTLDQLGRAEGCLAWLGRLSDSAIPSDPAGCHPVPANSVAKSVAAPAPGQ
jgi:hypothetical protein